MTFDECRAAWRDDWAAMKAGTYTAPLPHRNMVERYEPNPKRVAAINGRNVNV